jgi:glc operon protein GlcG
MKNQLVLECRDAQHAIQVIQDELSRRGKAAVIAVADAHGELMALLRMDGAPYSSITVATNKAFSAAREGKPSREIGQKMRDAKKGYAIAYYGDNRFTGFPGGLPVIVEGQVVGAVGVSGLSGAEDEELAQIGVTAILSGYKSE